MFWKLSQSASYDEQIQSKLCITIQTVFPGSSVIRSRQIGVRTIKSNPSHKTFVTSKLFFFGGGGGGGGHLPFFFCFGGLS